MPEDPVKKKKKKKFKKKRRKKVKRPEPEGRTGPTDDDALSAFGIESREVSKYKQAAGLRRVVEPPPSGSGEGPRPGKKVKKKRVKRIVKRVKKKVPKAEAIPVPEEKEPEAKKPDELDDILKEDDGPKVVEKLGPTPEEDEEDELEKAEDILDDLDLDDLTKSIEDDLLESFEEKIDDILDGFIDDEVPDGTGTDDEVKEVGNLIGDIKDPDVEIPAHAQDGKAEVEARPELKLEAEVEGAEKDAHIEEPVVIEKEGTKMIAEDTKEDDKDAQDRAPAPPSDKVRIDEGDGRERRVAFKVAHNFDKLPPNMRHELLRTLSKVDDPRVREDVVSAISTHFKSLPPEIQGLLTNLARDENVRVREEVVFEIQRNFDIITVNIRERVLRALVKDAEPSVREEVVGTICEHFNELSSDVRELLLTLAKDKVRSVRDELSFEMAKADSPVSKGFREEVQATLKGKR